MSDTDNLSLLAGLFPLIQFLHLCFAGFIVGGAGGSLLLAAVGMREQGRPHGQLAVDLLRQSIPNPSLFALLPLVAALNLVCLQLAFSPTFDRLLLCSAAMGLLVVGLGPIFYFRRRLLAEKGIGLTAIPLLAGLAALAAAYFLFFCEWGLLIRPERWPVLSSVPERLLSWSAVAEFSLFTLFFLAQAGTILLALSRRRDRTECYVQVARRGGVLLTLFALLAWPPLILLDLVNMPPLAFSTPFFAALAGVLILAAALCWRLAGRWSETGAVGPNLLLLLSLFLLFLFAHQLARSHALVPQTLERPAAARSAEPKGSGAVSAGQEKDDEDDEGGKVSGQAVFDRVCSSCHAFDRRVVGPPLNEVVPAYDGDREKLKGFIRDPEKVNPDYPAMPKLGLAEEEIDAVAGYLLQQAGGG